jgi:hypothetical protein
MSASRPEIFRQAFSVFSDSHFRSDDPSIFQCVAVGGFVTGLPSFSASVEYAHLLESQRTQGDLMRITDYERVTRHLFTYC